MRQFLLGLSISIAFIVGCVTAQHVPDVAMPSATASTSTSTLASTGQGWEYTCEALPVRTDRFVAMLNDQGTAGWEVIPFDFAGGRVCFKRPR